MLLRLGPVTTLHAPASHAAAAADRQEKIRCVEGKLEAGRPACGMLNDLPAFQEIVDRATVYCAACEQALG